MNKKYTSLGIASRIWFFTALVFSAGMFVYMSISSSEFNFVILPLSFVAALIGSIPAGIVIVIVLPFIGLLKLSWRWKFFGLLFLLFLITLPYGIAGAVLNILPYKFYNSNGEQDFLFALLIVSSTLFTCSLTATLYNLRRVYFYFNTDDTFIHSYSNIFSQLFIHTFKINNKMETHYQTSATQQQPNRILIKGLITGGLILLMLIPTLFINNLISEREARQKEVVKEVSSKWATAQTLSGPFLVVPYIDTALNNDGKAVTIKTKLLLLANELNVNGKIIPEERPRSIYKVLLYKTTINVAGSFKIKLPSDVNISNVDFPNAKLCFSLSDFKGIEEEIYVNFNRQKLLLSPGLPVADFGSIGLSVPVAITAEMLEEEMPFNMQVKIKGSEQLHFIPMSATSKFSLSSVWPSPSFDGNTLPSERQISAAGFSATWNFNQANLPFGTVIRENSVTNKAIDFGVSLVQPADQYNKTMRSVKYAILFIGLTFAFFFIIELMQKKPFHPVQYVLVGLALVIFYTLLLAISEYILFDYAYLVAAAATILLISFYAKGHFNSWKIAGIFFSLLSCLYGFIFILIRLEDTALLVGSIGLFVILALVMFVSRKINWYGQQTAIIST